MGTVGDISPKIRLVNPGHGKGIWHLSCGVDRDRIWERDYELEALRVVVDASGDPSSIGGGGIYEPEELRGGAAQVSIILKLKVDEDRLVLYSTVVALDKLGVPPDVLVERLISMIKDKSRLKEFTEMTVAVVESMTCESR